MANSALALCQLRTSSVLILFQCARALLTPYYTQSGLFRDEWIHKDDPLKPESESAMQQIHRPMAYIRFAVLGYRGFKSSLPFPNKPVVKGREGVGEDAVTATR